MINGTAKELAVGDLKPNPWNYNQQKDSTFAKLAASIRRHGFTRPLVVRTLPDGSHELVDGEHGWRAAMLLGMSHVPVFDIGVVSDSVAKEMCVVLNELGGQADEVRLGAIMRELHASPEVEAVLAAMPYSATQIELLTKQVDFSFQRSPKVDQRPPSESTKHARVVLRGDAASEAWDLIPEKAGDPGQYVIDAVRSYDG